MSPLKLATWNVNSLAVRLPRVLELVEAHGPDVLCLQETKSSAETFPAAVLREAGYEAVHHSGGRWAGVAILARRGLALEQPSQGLEGELAGDEARWVEATVAGLRVASVYVPNGRAVGSEAFAQKLAFLEAMAARTPVLDVLVGDMNVCPTDLDVYDPAAFVGSTHVTEEERARLRAVLEAGGLLDAFRTLHADEPGFTWWDYRQGHFHRKMGLRIDLALVRRSLADRLVSCGIDRAFRKGPKPSDHAPLLVEWE
ncbi:MAG: exodeoxyribonuclease III [Solirubrobacteraceae bacterium]